MDLLIEVVKRNLVKIGRAERVVFGYGGSDEDSSSLEEGEEEERNFGNMQQE